MEKLLKDKRLFKFLEQIDVELAEVAQAAGCKHCGEVLHHGDFTRKPRGGPAWDRRHSFCCSEEECRKRTTPVSVRFLGRKVYAGVIIVLICAMTHGLKSKRVKQICEALSISRQTLERWRIWWLEVFVGTGFWKAERARFMPGLKEALLPLPLVEVFGATTREGLIKLMKFLSPITVSARKGVAGM